MNTNSLENHKTTQRSFREEKEDAIPYKNIARKLDLKNFSKSGEIIAFCDDEDGFFWVVLQEFGKSVFHFYKVYGNQFDFEYEGFFADNGKLPKKRNSIKALFKKFDAFRYYVEQAAHEAWLEEYKPCVDEEACCEECFC